MKYRLGLMIISSVALLSIAGSSMATEHTISGKTAADVFKQPGLAELAGAACSGDVAAVQAAVKSGADPNGLSVDGGPVLLWVVYCQNDNGVEALLRAGADPNFGARGVTPTFAASGGRNVKVLATLLDHGGNVNAIDGSNSALSLAIIAGAGRNDWGNYNLLLSKGADINLSSGIPSTAAETALAVSRYDIVVDLLQRGYSHNLETLSAYVQMGNPFPPTSPQFTLRKKALEIIVSRGVVVPWPPLRDKK